MPEKIQTLQGPRHEKLVLRGAEAASAAAFGETKTKTDK